MTVHRHPNITPTDTGYRATCAVCGWVKEYKTKASARGGLAGHKCRPRCSHCGEVVRVLQSGTVQHLTPAAAATCKASRPRRGELPILSELMKGIVR